MNEHPTPTPAEEEIRELVLAVLAQIADVIDLHELTPEEREEIKRLEDAAEEYGAAGGTIAFVNEGVKKALESDRIFALTSGPMHRDPPAPWTIMVDAEDELIGEWLPSSRLEEAREGGRCIFLSEDFVMYKDRRPVGQARFIMPFVCLGVEDAPGVSVCGIGSPSTPADMYIRSLMGDPGPEVATWMVGVSLEPAPAGNDEGERDA
jgi:hypothetical protein